MSISADEAGASGRDGGFRTLSSEVVHEGEVLRVRVDRVAMGEGSQATREVVVVHDAVAVVALDRNGRVCLLRQYRQPIGGYCLEVPAGKIDVEGESPLASARRELAEEAALEASSWLALTSFLNSVGWTTERTCVFLATDLRDGASASFEASAEEAEMTLSWVSLEDALELVQSGEIADAKTIIGLLLTARRLSDTAGDD